MKKTKTNGKELKELTDNDLEKVTGGGLIQYIEQDYCTQEEKSECESQGLTLDSVFCRCI